MKWYTIALFLFVSFTTASEACPYLGQRLTPVLAVEHTKNRVDLCKSILTNEKTLGLNLESALFEEADLTGANLIMVNLKKANLYKANLSGADLSGSHLNKADLTNTILTGARLNSADLEGVKFNWVILKEGCDVEGCGQFPDIANAKNISKLQFMYSQRPPQINAFRAALRARGDEHEADQLTFAIQHSFLNSLEHETDESLSDWLMLWSQRIGFEYTVEWGAKPAHALILLLKIMVWSVLVNLFIFILTCRFSMDSDLYLKTETTSESLRERYQLQCLLRLRGKAQFVILKPAITF